MSTDLQESRDQLVILLIERCREELGNGREITGQTVPCRDLCICEEDLDDVQIDAAARMGLRPPYPGEPLVIPWHGPNQPNTIEDLAAWMAANGRSLDT